MHFPSIQELEEIEFEPATEQMNCLREAQAKRVELDSLCKIEGAGRFTLEVTVPYYCRATDALAGNYRLLKFSSDRREDCVARAAEFNDDDEVYCFISDSSPEPKVVAPRTFDDIPF